MNVGVKQSNEQMLQVPVFTSSFPWHLAIHPLSIYYLLDGGLVLDHLNTLRVRVVAHRERTGDRLGKLPVTNTSHVMM